VSEGVAEISLSRCTPLCLVRKGRYNFTCSSTLDGSRGDWSASRSDRFITLEDVKPLL
jgi:hypothetical protein